MTTDNINSDDLAEGLLVIPAGNNFGFLRLATNSYAPGPDDVFVSTDLIKNYRLRPADRISGHWREPSSERHRYRSLADILAVNRQEPDKSIARPHFDDLIPTYPDQQIKLEYPDSSPTPKNITPRVIDLITPLGRGQRCMIVAPPRVGKCLGKGTLVITANGATIPVESVNVGDRLIGPDNNIRNVLSINTGKGKLYKITPIRGEPWICNDVHVLTLVNTDTDEIIDIPLDRWLAKSKWFKERHKLFSVGIDNFPDNENTTLPIDPYFLGVWFGDGTKTVGEHGKVSGIGISKPDKEIQDVCMSVARQWGLRCDTHIDQDKHGNDKCPLYRLVSDERGGWQQRTINALLDALRNLVGNDIKIPDSYLRADKQARLQFLAGFLDTDSEMNNKCFVLTQKREDWAMAVWWLARSVGLSSTITTRIGRCKRPDGTIFEGNYWVITISGNTDIVPTRIIRKQAASRIRQTNPTRTGFTVEPLNEGDYYGFTLDGDGRFLLGDFTVTHNTTILQDIGLAIQKNYKDIAIIILLIDERPEEVTDMREVLGNDDRTNVIASTFDEMPERHIEVAEVVIERAKRLAEMKTHVVILLDSLTRLARAYNTVIPASGRVMSGGLDAKTMPYPKKIFGAARNLRDSGSITIVGTALVDTGSKMDDIIFEEFKGTGNSEIHLDRRLMAKRIFPCIDMNKSGTRKEELLLDKDVKESMDAARQLVFANGDAVANMEVLTERLKKTKYNSDFIKTMKGGR